MTLFENNWASRIGISGKADTQAFPGDTYISDLWAASKVGKPWARRLWIAVAFGFFADLYFLHDTVDVAFNNKSGSFESLLSWIVAMALVLLYLFIGDIAGKKLREYCTFKNGSSLAATVLATVVLLLALFALTVFRLSSEILSTTQESHAVGMIVGSFFSYLASPDYVDAASKVFVMTFVMMLSAFVAALRAYFSNDTVSEAVYKSAIESLPADRALYNKVFLERANNPEKDREYEANERELDKQTIRSAFKLGSIASQLNGMVDPADAHEFLRIQQALTLGYSGREDK